MKWQEANFDFPLPMRYHLTPPSESGAVILLHGYQDNAPSMLKRLGWAESPPPFQVLAINAPFPVPVWNADGFKEAYSWYFRDSSRGLVIVSPETTAERVARLLRDLQLENTPKVFLGFSQGGYLAPHVALRTQATRGILGLGCGFAESAYQPLSRMPVHALHGEKDERVSLEQSREEHRRLSALGFPGDFHVLPDFGHKVSRDIEPLARELALRLLGGER